MNGGILQGNPQVKDRYARKLDLDLDKQIGQMECALMCALKGPFLFLLLRCFISEMVRTSDI